MAEQGLRLSLVVLLASLQEQCELSRGFLIGSLLNFGGYYCFWQVFCVHKNTWRVLCVRLLQVQQYLCQKSRLKKVGKIVVALVKSGDLGEKKCSVRCRHPGAGTGHMKVLASRVCLVRKKWKTQSSTLPICTLLH